MYLFGVDRDSELNFNCQISYGEYYFLFYEITIFLMSHIMMREFYAF